jgi:hypothetical protein
MKKSYDPAEQDLPSTKQLINSTLLAAGVAAALLVTVVMPAEYGIDPTGIGSITGLKKMGEIRVSLAKEEARDRANNSGTSNEKNNPSVKSTPQLIKSTPQLISSTANSLSHQTEVTLAPDEGAEVKVVMSQGKKMQYSWSTDSGKANFDVHADSQELGIDYHPYSKGAEAFDGSHGWFWRNRTSNPIVITLKTQGEYTDIKRVQ